MAHIEPDKERPVNFDKPLIREDLRSAIAANTAESPREKYLRLFKEYTSTMFEITSKKNNDYGGVEDPFKNFREFGSYGIVVRMGDKWARIKTALVEKRALQVVDETINDTILDLANYCVILLCYRKMNKEQ